MSDPRSEIAPSESPDVVVIGGGPAGSTVSTLIAQQGRRVQLFERERFPRFHIGESLIPETYWVLKRLNMLPKMQRSPFVKKHSVQFVNAIGTFLYNVTDPVLRPIRRVMPDLGGIDISPIIVLLLIFFLRSLLWTSIYPMVA